MTAHLQFFASFLIHFVCWKLAMKVANGSHVTVGHGDYDKCVPVAKCARITTVGMLQWPQLQGPVVSHIMQGWHNLEWSLNNWTLSEDYL